MLQAGYRLCEVGSIVPKQWFARKCLYIVCIGGIFLVNFGSPFVKVSVETLRSSNKKCERQWK